MLEFVRLSVGAGKITNKRTVSRQHRKSFTYAITNRQAIRLLADIEQYPRTYKADRARMMVKDYIGLTPRNGRYTAEMAGTRPAFEDAILAVRPRD